MRHCVVAYEKEEYRGVMRCPFCGKFMKWHGWDKGYSCKCNGIINLKGHGDEESNEDRASWAIRICKKPDGWTGGIFFEDTEELWK